MMSMFCLVDYNFLTYFQFDIYHLHKMKRLAYFFFAATFLFIATLILRPVPIVTESEALTTSGTVTYVYEGGVKDVVLRIKDSPRTYYINRGLEEGLEIKALQEKLIGEEVTIKYPQYWTPLDWNDKVKHLSKLEHRGEVIYNELR